MHLSSLLENLPPKDCPSAQLIPHPTPIPPNGASVPAALTAPDPDVAETFLFSAVISTAGFVSLSWRGVRRLPADARPATARSVRVERAIVAFFFSGSKAIR